MVETSGYAEHDAFENILQYIDWLYIDLKHCIGDRHLSVTGCGNKLIFDNLLFASQYLKEKRKILVIRQVVVPGINDGKWIPDMIDLICKLPYVTALEFLPYHNLGMDKYEALGREYNLKNISPPDTEVINTYKEIAEAKGLKCSISEL